MVYVVKMMIHMVNLWIFDQLYWIFVVMQIVRGENRCSVTKDGEQRYEPDISETMTFLETLVKCIFVVMLIKIWMIWSCWCCCVRIWYWWNTKIILLLDDVQLDKVNRRDTLIQSVTDNVDYCDNSHKLVMKIIIAKKVLKLVLKKCWQWKCWC